jgi:hypothetical protein
MNEQEGCIFPKSQSYDSSFVCEPDRQQEGTRTKELVAHLVSTIFAKEDPSFKATTLLDFGLLDHNLSVPSVRVQDRFKTIAYPAKNYLYDKKICRLLYKDNLTPH